MSAAIRAKTAKERATIAAGLIRRGATDSRAFADCFEMGDGDAVIAALRLKARADQKIATYAMRAGWLDMTDAHLLSPTHHAGPLEVVAHEGQTLIARTFDRSATFRIDSADAVPLPVRPS